MDDDHIEPEVDRILNAVTVHADLANRVSKISFRRKINLMQDGDVTGETKDDSWSDYQIDVEFFPNERPGSA